MKRIAYAMWGLLIALPWACGGGASIEDVCEKVAACDENQTVEECVEETQELEQQAEAAGCSGELDDFVDCADDNFQCNDGEIAIPCESELFNLFTCAGGENIGVECGWSCDGEGGCTCSDGPTGAACCEQGTSGCSAELVCENDCCG